LREAKLTVEMAEVLEGGFWYDYTGSLSKHSNLLAKCMAYSVRALAVFELIGRFILNCFKALFARGFES
jgi:hypothetical protein